MAAGRFAPAPPRDGLWDERFAPVGPDTTGLIASACGDWLEMLSFPSSPVTPTEPGREVTAAVSGEPFLRPGSLAICLDDELVACA